MNKILSSLSISSLGALALLGACGVDAVDAVDNEAATTEPESAATSAVTGSGDRLPSLVNLPNISAAAARVFGPSPVVRAVFSTSSGFQIYRCDLNAAGQPAWALRTPLARMAPSGPTAVALSNVSNGYHARSDFGGLLSDGELSALGLIDAAGVRTTAPTWQFTFTASRRDLFTPVRREVVAGRVLAQDASAPTSNIPDLLVEVRGRSISTIAGGVTTAVSNRPDPVANPIASADYLLRFSSVGGVAPAAGECATATLGIESQQYYSTYYYFIDTNSP
jgi:Protein of unknown function (DUF3455)